MGQVGGQAWVGSDGSVATRLMQIGNRPVRKKEGFVDEERRDGEAVRRETRLKENEKKKKKTLSTSVHFHI